MATALSRELGAYHIANNSVEYNPQRKNNFTLVVHGLEDIPRIGSIDPDIDGGALTEEDIIQDGQNEIRLALASCQTPSMSQGTIEVPRGNSKVKYAGTVSFNTLDITVNDYIGGQAKDVLLAWQNQSYNPKYDYVGSKSSYKKDCELFQLTPDGQLVNYWEIKGAWLSSVTPGDYSMSDGDSIQTVSATIVYDWAILHKPDEFEI